MADAGYLAGRRQFVRGRREILDCRGTRGREPGGEGADSSGQAESVEESRAEFEAAEKRRQQEEEARDLQRVKDNAAAEIHAVEQAANQRSAANAGNVKGAVPWFGDPSGQKVSGTLTRVECLNGGPLRLTIQQAGFPVRC